MTAPTLLAAADVWEVAATQHTPVFGMYDEVGGPLYADFCAGDRQEIPEILAALRRARGDVLELAAGAGRLTLPLLATGRRVVATELSPTMLRLLEEQLRNAPRAMQERCEIRPADMTDFEFDETFGVIVLGTTSISLLDAAQRNAMFKHVRMHLAPGGSFLLTTLDLGSSGRTQTDAEHVMADSSGTEYVLAERVVPGHGVREVALAPRRRNDDGSIDFICRSSVNVLPATTLVDEAAAAGLTLVSTQECAGFESRYVAHLLVFTAGGDV